MGVSEDAVLMSSALISPMAVCIGFVIGSLVRLVICAWPNKKLLSYSFGQQMFDISPNLLITAVMAVSVWSISFIQLPDIVTLLIQVPLGAVVYIGLSFLTRSEPLFYIIDVLGSYFKKRRKYEH